MTIPEMPEGCVLYYEQRYESWSWKWQIGSAIVTRHSFRTPEDAKRDCAEFLAQAYSEGLTS